MLDFLRSLSPSSMALYAIGKLTGAKAPICLRLASGTRFVLRPRLPENNDYGVAYEVFVTRDYDPPPGIDRSRVRQVVDIGGNVGFSALYWLNTFPNATVDVFEPNPLHLVQMERNFRENPQYASRVTVHPKAAGSAARAARFSSQGASSAIVGDGGGDFTVDVVDILDLLRNRPIDVLKLDVEGAEYEILGDDRFGGLQVANLILEWHPRPGGQDDGAWCEARLRRFGYTVQPRSAWPTPNLFWAWRSP